LILDLRSELNTHLAPQALCRVLLGTTATVTSFPLSKHTGEVALHPPSPASVFIYSSHGKWVFPPLQWSFPPTSTFTSFPTPGCWAGASTPAFSGQFVYLQFTEEVSLPFSPVEFSLYRHFYKLSRSNVAGRGPPLLPFPASLFFYSSVRDFPSPPLQHSGHPALFATCLFCCCLLFSLFFSLFSLGGGWSVQGVMLIWPRAVCGSTKCRLAHLVVCIFPSSLEAGIWQRRSPPCFSV
jgi:hypothetical protein